MTEGERTLSLALRLRTLGFPSARLMIQLNLAIDQNSLARFSTRIVRRWSKTFHAAHACYRLVSGSFHCPSSLLFRFRSRYYCAIGLRMYLELEVHASHSRAISSARYSGYPESPTVCLYGAVTLCGRPFQTEFEFTNTEYPGPQLHISHIFRCGIRFALCRFRSPLLTASRLISFPPLTKMLQFGGCPTLTGHMGLPMSEVLFGHPRIKGSLRLHEAFRSLARPSSAPEPSHSPDDYKSPKRQFDRRPALRMSRWS